MIVARARGVAAARVEAGAESKIATRVAARVEDALLARGWPCGEIFGSCDSLARDYRVGRSVAHEVLRILETRGSCGTKRGPGGGVFVAAPSLPRVVLALSVALMKGGATRRDLVQAREALDRETNARAATRGEALDQAIRRMAGMPAGAGPRERLVRHYRLRDALAEASGNPALFLFGHCLTRLSLGLVQFGSTPVSPELAQLLDRHEAAIARAAEGETGRRQQMEIAGRLAVAVDERVLGGAPPEQRLDRVLRIDSIADTAGPVPQPIRIARLIAADVLSGRWPAGQRIGTEIELCDAYGASQMTLRQAVRLLEEFELAEMRQGRGKGLFSLTGPGLGPATRMAHGYFASHRFAGADWWQAMSPLQTELVERAEEATTAEQRAALRFVLPGERSSDRLAGIIEIQMEAMRWIASASQSRILAAFWQVLISYRHRAISRRHGESRAWCERFANRCDSWLLPFVRSRDGSGGKVDAMMSVAADPGFSDWMRSPFDGRC